MKIPFCYIENLGIKVIKPLIGVLLEWQWTSSGRCWTRRCLCCQKISPATLKKTIAVSILYQKKNVFNSNDQWKHFDRSTYFKLCNDFFCVSNRTHAKNDMVVTKTISINHRLLKSCIHVNKQPDWDTLLKQVSTAFKKWLSCQTLTEKPEYPFTMVGLLLDPYFYHKNIPFVSSANQIQHEMEEEDEDDLLRNQKGRGMFSGTVFCIIKGHKVSLYSPGGQSVSSVSPVSKQMSIISAAGKFISSNNGMEIFRKKATLVRQGAHI